MVSSPRPWRYKYQSIVPKLLIQSSTSPPPPAPLHLYYSSTSPPTPSPLLYFTTSTSEMASSSDYYFEAIQLVHAKGDNFPCKRCFMPFKSPSQLLRHLTHSKLCKLEYGEDFVGVMRRESRLTSKRSMTKRRLGSTKSQRFQMFTSVIRTRLRPSMKT